MRASSDSQILNILTTVAMAMKKPLKISHLGLMAINFGAYSLRYHINWIEFNRRPLPFGKSCQTCLAYLIFTVLLGTWNPVEKHLLDKYMMWRWRYQVFQHIQDGKDRHTNCIVMKEGRLPDRDIAIHTFLALKQKVIKSECSISFLLQVCAVLTFCTMDLVGQLLRSADNLSFKLI